MHFHNSQPTPPPSDGSDTSDQPTQVFHPSFVPKPSGILGSAASGAHYSGAKVHHRRSDIQRASGSRDLSELTESHQRIISDLSELYCCRPTAEIFRRSFREDADFEDPLTYSKGIQEIASQWYALPKIFAKSETQASRVLSSTQHPNRIVYSQTQQYTVRFLGTKHNVKSIIIVNLDENDKIMRLEDQWNGEEPPTAWGLATLRRLNGKLTPWLIRVPKGLRE